MHTRVGVYAMLVIIFYMGTYILCMLFASILCILLEYEHIFTLSYAIHHTY